MMVDAVRFQVDGLRQLGAALRELGDVTARKICGQATGAAARIVKAADKQNLQRSSIDTGLVEKNVIVKKLSKSKSEGLTAAHIVTVKKARYAADNRSGKRNTRRSASFLEFGTVNMPAEPHLGPALLNNLRRAETAMKDKLAAGIARAAQRLPK